MQTLWTVYDRFPDPYLALLSVAGGDACRVLVSSDLPALRNELKARGCECLGRDPDDCRSIIEVWGAS